jgi:membrane protein required for colicin V production
MGALSVTAIDIVLAAVLVISAGLAFARGLVHETFAILEWVAAAYCALRFTPALLPLLAGTISPAWLEYGVVFLGTFLIVLIPLSFLSHRLEEVVRHSDVGPVDRALGFVFGIGRGLVIAGVAFIV